jgi:hypothetical protein
MSVGILGSVEKENKNKNKKMKCVGVLNLKLFVARRTCRFANVAKFKHMGVKVTNLYYICN